MSLADVRIADVKRKHRTHIIDELWTEGQVDDHFLPSFSLSLANIPLSPETAQDQERRIRREIANSNERRRMQSINAGFQSLKTLLPHTDGEKLSKVLFFSSTLSKSHVKVLF